MVKIFRKLRCNMPCHSIDMKLYITCVAYVAHVSAIDYKLIRYVSIRIPKLCLTTQQSLLKHTISSFSNLFLQQFFTFLNEQIVM